MGSPGAAGSATRMRHASQPAFDGARRQYGEIVGEGSEEQGTGGLEDLSQSTPTCSKQTSFSYKTPINFAVGASSTGPRGLATSASASASKHCLLAPLSTTHPGRMSC